MRTMDFVVVLGKDAKKVPDTLNSPFRAGVYRSLQKLAVSVVFGWGPAKIRAWLQRQYPGWPCYPADSTTAPTIPPDRGKTVFLRKFQLLYIRPTARPTAGTIDRGRF